jgi:hypothetical protein
LNIINVVKDAYTSDSQAQFSGYVISKYKLSFEGLKIGYKDLEEAISAIKTKAFF